MFQQFRQTNFSVPNLTSLMERLYCGTTGRFLFYNILAVEISKIEI